MPDWKIYRNKNFTYLGDIYFTYLLVKLYIMCAKMIAS